MRAPHRLGAVLLAVALTAVPSTPSTAGGGLVASSAAAAGAPRCQGEPATLVGTRGPDRLRGTRGRDVVVGRAGNDRIDGRGGADVICGGGGRDVLVGGRGADRLAGGIDQRAEGTAGSYLVGDTLVGGPGNDRLDGGVDGRSADQRRGPDTYSWADSRRRVRVDLSGPDGLGSARGRGRDTVVVGRTSGIVGTPRGDRLVGSPGRDVVRGGDGADRITTARGNDQAFPDSGRDASGSDVVVTGGGDDLVSSTAGRDRILTGPGEDFVEAFSERPSVVRLGAGGDYVGQWVTPGSGAGADGGTGHDVIAFYGRLLAAEDPGSRFVVDLRDGATRSTGDVATGTVAGFEGHRFVGRLAWTFLGTGRDDRVWAIEGGPLRARAGAGDDSVTGTRRDDVIGGGSGTDFADGGGGDDRCRSIERGDC